jgi:transcriptional regulator
MYNPSAYREDRLPVVHEFIRTHPFAMLVTNGPDGLFASHLPFVLDAEDGEHGTLVGHLARANPHVRMLDDGAESLVVFSGPHAYVSPNWYPGKQEHGREVPTWNYVTVHAYGAATTFNDAAELRALLDRLTDTHEAKFPKPWRVGDAPADYLEQMYRAIVGIRVPIARIEGKWKLSQNRQAPDRIGAKAGLAASFDPRDREVAALMRDD